MELEFEKLKNKIITCRKCSRLVKFQKKTSIKKKERLHKDGIYFDLNSPEAFDEIFFSSFKDNELKYELIYFINLILLNKITKRYLSKNNLNYKRIDLILSILPNSIFLIPFREPLQHSFSLFKLSTLAPHFWARVVRFFIISYV